MKIAIDNDDINLDFLNPFLKYVNQQKGLSIQYDHVWTPRYEHVWNGTREETDNLVIDFFTKNDSWRNMQFINGAPPALQQIQAKHSPTILTATPLATISVRDPWLEQKLSSVNLAIPRIYSHNYHGQRRPKVEICQEEKFDLLIEDNGAYADECAQQGIHAIIMEKPWNRECKENPFVTRCQDWEHVLQTIESLERKLQK